MKDEGPRINDQVLVRNRFRLGEKGPFSVVPTIPTAVPFTSPFPSLVVADGFLSARAKEKKRKEERRPEIISQKSSLRPDVSAI